MTTAPSTELVTFTLDQGVAVVRMDDGKANALSDAMIEALRAALVRAEKEARAIVVAGREDRFCAGFDLKIMMSGPEAAMTLLRAGAALFLAAYGSPLPVVVACTGHALAGGALLLLTGDVRIGAAGAYRIGLNEVSIGMPLPVLGMELARDRLAPGELARATLQAHIYSPEGASTAGYLDEVVPAADVVGRAKDEALRLASLPRPAFHATKMRLRGRTIAHIGETLEEDMARITRGG